MTAKFYISTIGNMMTAFHTHRSNKQWPGLLNLASPKHYRGGKVIQACALFMALQSPAGLWAAEGKDSVNNPASVHETAETATSGFFQKIATADLNGISRYLTPDGFSELSPEWAGIKMLDLAAFERAFKAGVHLDFRATELQVRELGSTTIVTGYRMGSITPPNGKPIDSPLAFTMVWTHTGADWKLAHLHLSPIPAKK